MRNINSSPDLGIESDQGRFSSLEATSSGVQIDTPKEVSIVEICGSGLNPNLSSLVINSGECIICVMQKMQFHSSYCAGLECFYLAKFCLNCLSGLFCGLSCRRLGVSHMCTSNNIGLPDKSNTPSLPAVIHTHTIGLYATSTMFFTDQKLTNSLYQFIQWNVC